MLFITFVELLSSYFPQLNLPKWKIGEWGTGMQKSTKSGEAIKKVKKTIFLKNSTHSGFAALNIFVETCG